MVSVQKEVEATGVSLGADFVERWNAGLPDLFAHGVEAIPFVREFIEAVRTAGIATCVASIGTDIENAHHAWPDRGCCRYSSMRCSARPWSRVASRFPTCSCMRRKRWGFAPADCIVIEDSVAGNASRRSQPACAFFPIMATRIPTETSLAEARRHHCSTTCANWPGWCRSTDLICPICIPGWTPRLSVLAWRRANPGPRMKTTHASLHSRLLCCCRAFGRQRRTGRHLSGSRQRVPGHKDVTYFDLARDGHP